MSESQTAALIFNLKFANINFLAFANEAGCRNFGHYP